VPATKALSTAEAMPTAEAVSVAEGLNSVLVRYSPNDAEVCHAVRIARCRSLTR
jgi:hypothetical protein